MLHPAQTGVLMGYVITTETLFHHPNGFPTHQSIATEVAVQGTVVVAKETGWSAVQHVVDEKTNTGNIWQNQKSN